MGVLVVCGVLVVSVWALHSSLTPGLMTGAAAHGLSIEQLLSLDPSVRVGGGLSVNTAVYVIILRTFAASVGHPNPSLPDGALLSLGCHGDPGDGGHVEA